MGDRQSVSSQDVHVWMRYFVGSNGSERRRFGFALGSWRQDLPDTVSCSAEYSDEDMYVPRIEVSGPRREVVDSLRGFFDDYGFPTDGYVDDNLVVQEALTTPGFLSRDE